jgi:hypothetical protein
MSANGPQEARNKFNFFTKDEIKRAISELEEVKKQIEKRTDQIKKISETSLDLSHRTIPGTLNFKDIVLKKTSEEDPERDI